MTLDPSRRQMRFYEGDVVRTPTGREAVVLGMTGARYDLRYLGAEEDEVLLNGGHLRLVRRAEE